MRVSLLACALAALAAFGAPAAAMPQGTLAPMAKLQAQIGEAAESAAMLETAPQPKELIPGTKEWENSSQCFVGDVNICTRESKAWTARTQMAAVFDTMKKLPKALENILGPKNVKSGYEGYALIEGEMEGESALEADVDAEADEEAETESEEAAGADEDESSAFMESAAQGKCSGRCQAKNLPCATSYASGMCTGASNIKCCVAAKSSAPKKTTSVPKKTTKTTTKKTATPKKTTTKKATTKKTTTPTKKTPTPTKSTTKKATTKKTTKTVAEPEVVGPLTLTGVSKRIRDPRKELMKKGHRMHWGDFTIQQQTNARLLVAAAKLESPTATANQIAYIVGTANWECLLHPISEWGGRNTRYAPYYGRGFVQLTWQKNYQKMTDLLLSKRGITANLVEQPNLALDPTNAAFIAAYGMFHGTFTTKKLSDYFTAKKSDWTNARRIINGLDKAAAIGTLSKQWVPLVQLLMQE